MAWIAFYSTFHQAYQPDAVFHCPAWIVAMQKIKLNKRSFTNLLTGVHNPLFNFLPRGSNKAEQCINGGSADLIGLTSKITTNHCFISRTRFQGIIFSLPGIIPVCPIMDHPGAAVCKVLAEFSFGQIGVDVIEVTLLAFHESISHSRSTYCASTFVSTAGPPPCSSLCGRVSSQYEPHSGQRYKVCHRYPSTLILVRPDSNSMALSSVYWLLALHLHMVLQSPNPKPALWFE